jgi:hypothetical protein
MASKTKTRARLPAKSQLEEILIDPLDIELDPNNPRLSPSERGSAPAKLLEILISRFKLEELGESIVASGYTDLDPILAYRAGGAVVVREGNRRVGALKLLLDPTLASEKYRPTWVKLSTSLEPNIRAQIKSLRVLVYKDVNDDDVESYIGFRHVSGVLEWPPEEKARFIVELVDKHGWSYTEIAKRIGSFPRHVERHYIASRILDPAIELEIPGSSNMQFGVLLRSLQASGVSEFLGVTYPGNPKKSAKPIPATKTDEFTFFVAGTFGTDDVPPILPESRELTRWGQILQSADAVRYLKTAERPTFERAWLKCGGKQRSVLDLIEAAADNIEDALAMLPDFKDDVEIGNALERCARRLNQALRDFPNIKSPLLADA